MDFIYNDLVGPTVNLEWTKKVKANSEFKSCGSKLYYRNKSKITCLNVKNGNEDWEYDFKGLEDFTPTADELFLSIKGSLYKFSIDSLTLDKISPINFLLITGFYKNLLINSSGQVFDLVNKSICHESNNSWEFVVENYAFSKKRDEKFLTVLELENLVLKEVPCIPKSLAYFNETHCYFRDKQGVYIYDFEKKTLSLKQSFVIDKPLNDFSKNYIGGFVEGNYYLYSNKTEEIILTLPEISNIFYSAEKMVWVYRNENIECIDIFNGEPTITIPRNFQTIVCIGNGFIVLKSENDKEIYCFCNTE